MEASLVSFASKKRWLTWSHDVLSWNCKQPGCGCSVMETLFRDSGWKLMTTKWYNKTISAWILSPYTVMRVLHFWLLINNNIFQHFGDKLTNIGSTVSDMGHMQTLYWQHLAYYLTSTCWLSPACFPEITPSYAGYPKETGDCWCEIFCTVNAFSHPTKR